MNINKFTRKELLLLGIATIGMKKVVFETDVLAFKRWK